MPVARIVVRFCGLFFALAVLGFLGADAVARTLTPFLEGAMHGFGRAFEFELTTAPDEGGTMEVLAVAVREVALAPELTVNPGARISASGHTLHLLLPGLLFLSAFFAVPFSEPRAAVRSLLFAVPGVLCVEALTAGATLLGLIEITLQQEALRFERPRREPFVIHWTLFMESGGAWLVATITAIGLRAIQRPVDSSTDDG